MSLTVTAGTNDSFSGGSSIGSSAGSKTDSGVGANVVELSTTRNLSKLCFRFVTLAHHAKRGSGMQSATQVCKARLRYAKRVAKRAHLPSERG
jgi:hypothetical protein